MIQRRRVLIAHASTEETRKARALALTALEAALRAVEPARLVRKALRVRSNRLEVGRRSFDLSRVDRLRVVGAGKAAAGMAAACEERLERHIDDGVIVVPLGTKRPRLRRVRVVEANHPLPDESALDAGNAIVKVVRGLSERDLLLCLFSGGASALLARPRAGLSLRDKRNLTTTLLRAGANIVELNTVRKHLSELKGGGLARLAAPARIISLLLSDVASDRVDVIASGPTVPDPTTFADAVRILRTYDLWHRAPSGVREVLSEGVAGHLPETPKPGDPAFASSHTVIIGSCATACHGALRNLQQRGVPTLLLSTTLEGEASQVGRVLAAIMRETVASGRPVQRPGALLLGGETTVRVRGHGKGGRNQELLVAAASRIAELPGCAIAALGTDGVDGPTEAAGAIVDGGTATRARSMGLDPNRYLRANDSYTFFTRLDDLLRTGPTGTNVGDVLVATFA